MKPLPADVVPEWIRSVQPYLAGRPVRELERELGQSIIQLASNENPLGPSPKAMAAAREALADGHRYSNGGDQYLREALAARHGVCVDNIILGAGSSEIIGLAARALLGPGDAGVTSRSTFPLYPINIRITGAGLIEAPLRDYAIDLEAITAALPARTKIIFLANPNNPTGTMFTAGEFEAFLARVPQNVLVVIDEAYCDYVARNDYPRSIEMLRERRNILILRTFSKVFGLAGYRIGYGIGDSALIREFDKIRAPYNTSLVAEAAALAALEDRGHVQQSVDCNREGLSQLARGLEVIGASYVPSFANFMLVNLQRDAQEIAAQLQKSAVLARSMGFMGLPESIRVSVGTNIQMTKFLFALAQIQREAQTARAKTREDR